MKKLVFVAVFVMGFSAMAIAQDLPAYEIFTGYSYLRLAPTGSSGDLQGWNIAVAFNKNKNAALVANFSGNYGKVQDPLFLTNGKATIRNAKVHSVLFGPKIAFPQGRFSPFVQALFGVYHVNYGGMKKRDTENDFGLDAGFGMDIEVSKQISVRPFQAEYVAIRSQGNLQSDYRLSAGAVFKIGKKY
jgi:hypothetical protein